jgi:hypothetical protein
VAEELKKALDRKIVALIDEFWLGKLQEVANGEPVDPKVLRIVLPRHPEFIEVAMRYRNRELCLTQAIKILEPFYPKFLADYAAEMAARRAANYHDVIEDKPA